MNKYASLMPQAIAVLQDKQTEAPYSGQYNTCVYQGTYVCRGCGLCLFRASSQFDSGCGWPSFDEEIAGAILEKLDFDGSRTEILCSRCEGHIGHVFLGERKTIKNKRYCVNSLAVEFIKNNSITHTEEAIVAAGCFWGVQYYFDQLKGVLKTEVGYMGGHQSFPTYESVCSQKTGHLEVVRIVYDPTIISYRSIIQYFFEIHDPEQATGQGPDMGEQYLSAIFYFNTTQKNIAEQVKSILIEQGLLVATKLYEMAIFWPAELYHQTYYQKNQKIPYCHRWVKRF